MRLAAFQKELDEQLAAERLLSHHKRANSFPMPGDVRLLRASKTVPSFVSIMSSTTPSKTTYTSLLPYGGLAQESRLLRETVVSRLLKSIENVDRYKIAHYITVLRNTFLYVHYKLDEKDLVSLIDAFYALLFSKHLNDRLFANAASILPDLLQRVKKRHKIKPVLDFRPLFELYTELKWPKSRSSMAPFPSTRVKASVLAPVVRAARKYFAPGSAAQLVTMLRPYLSDTLRSEGFNAQELFMTFLCHQEADVWTPVLFETWDNVRSEDSGWNQAYMRLLARLSAKNIGQSPWLTEQLAAKVFSVGLLDLDVTLAGTSLPRLASVKGYSSQKSLMRIVLNALTPQSAPMLMPFLTKYFATITRYFHPSNAGAWTPKMTSILFSFGVVLCKRARKERKADTSIPVESRLTSEQYSQLTLLIRPIGMLAMFSKNADMRSRARALFRDFAYLGGDQMLEPVIERMYEAFDSEIGDAKQSAAALDILSTLAHPLFRSEDARGHMLQFLMLALPGIDANDRPKTLATIKLMLSCVSHIQLDVNAHSEFVFMLLDRLFEFFSHLGEPGQHQAFQQEGMILRVFANVFFAQLSPELLALVRTKLVGWIDAETYCNALYEVGLFVEGLMCADSGRGLEALIPVLCCPLLKEPSDTRAHWCLELLADTCRRGGAALVSHLPKIRQVIDVCFAHERKKDRKKAAHVLASALFSLTQINIVNFRNDAPLSEDLPVKASLVGKDIWHVPCDAEIDAACELTFHYLEAAEAADSDEISLKRAIYLMGALLRGNGDLLAEPSDLVPPRDEHGLEPYFNQRIIAAARPQPEPLRQVRKRISEALLKFAPSASNSILRSICKTITLMTSRRALDPSVAALDAAAAWGLKDKYANRLNKKQRPHIVHLLILEWRNRSRVQVQNRDISDGTTNRALMDLALELSLHSYEQVRKIAQVSLAHCGRRLPLARTLWIPRIIESISNSDTPEGALKGATYVISDVMQIITTKWRLLRNFLFALPRAQVHEKASVQKRMDHLFMQFVMQAYEIPLDIPSPNAYLQERQAQNHVDYRVIIADHIDLLEKGGQQVHWRYQLMLSTSLAMMLRVGEPVDPRVASYFASNIGDDVVVIRGVSGAVIPMILQLEDDRKRAHARGAPYSGVEAAARVAFRVEPSRVQALVWDDLGDVQRLITHQVNAHQFSDEDSKRAAPSMHSIQRLMKQHGRSVSSDMIFSVAGAAAGRSGGPGALDSVAQLYVSTGSRRFPRTTLAASLEGILLQHCALWKSLFKVFRMALLKRLVARLGKLLDDKRRESQCTAAEIIGAAIRSSKNWIPQEIEELSGVLSPLLERGLDGAAPDNVADWCTVLRYSVDKRTREQTGWLEELVLRDPFRAEGSTIQAKRLEYSSALLTEVGDARPAECARFLEVMEAHFDDHFKQVRGAIAKALNNMFAFGHKEAIYAQVLGRMVERCLVEAQDKDEPLSRYRDTMLTFLGVGFRRSIASRSAAIMAEYPRLIGVLFAAYHDVDPDVQKLARGITPLFAQFTFAPGDSAVLLELLAALRRVLELSGSSWMVRAALGPVLQILAFNHRFLLSRADAEELAWPIVELLLLDSSVDVRRSGAAAAASMLTGETRPALLRDRLEVFTRWASTRLPRGARARASPEDVCRRHAGVLGYTAVLDSSPYSVPEWLPGVSMQLVSHVKDPEPIGATVRAALQDFWRTHRGHGWDKDELKWSRDDLTQLKESGSYAPSYII